MSSTKTRAESATTAFPSMLETLWATSEAEETHSLKHVTGVDLIRPDVGISNAEDVSGRSMTKVRVTTISYSMT